jgi:uncharacterized protein related to proFAR isomerase
MKTPKMNIMSKKNKKQNSELIEKLNEIQSQLNDIKSDAGVEVEETITFTREQLQDFLVEYTNKVNEYVFDETYNSIDTDEVISLDVDGREINPSINEDTLRDCFMEATSNLDTDIIMEYADEAMSEVGVI